MNEQQINRAYKNYLKIPIHKLKELFPIQPPIFAGQVGTDMYPGSDHDGEIITYSYVEQHQSFNWMINWVMFNTEGWKWWKELGK